MGLIGIFALQADIMQAEEFLAFFYRQAEIAGKYLQGFVGKNTFIFQGFMDRCSFNSGIA